MWKVEICISMSFVEYVSSYSLNVSIQLAILHPWMFLHLIWYSLPSNSRYLVWNCFEFTTAVWFWHPEYIADKKIVYVQWFFFYVVQHFFPGIFSFELDDYALFGWLISRGWGAGFYCSYSECEYQRSPAPAATVTSPASSDHPNSWLHVGTVYCGLRE